MPDPRYETEAGFLQCVREMAQWHGWRTYHTLRSTGSESGYPDVTLVRGHRLILAELKTDTGKVTRAQLAWLTALEHVTTTESYLWRPRTFAAVERLLQRES